MIKEIVFIQKTREITSKFIINQKKMGMNIFKIKNINLFKIKKNIIYFKIIVINSMFFVRIKIIKNYQKIMINH